MNISPNFNFNTANMILNNKALAAAISTLVLPMHTLGQQTNSTEIYYDTTWAGPVQLASTTSPSTNATSGFNLAEATLIMPHLSLPKKPHEQVDKYTASYWVGLDGFVTTSSTSTAVRGLWQAGAIMSLSPATANTSQTTSYEAFYEWVPEDPVSLTPEQFKLEEGDHLHVLLNTSNGGLVGSLSLTNLNTSQVFSITRDAPVSWRGPTWPAPGSSAEWIVEAGTYLNGTRYVWPDFGVVRFLDARACYNTTGECVDAGRAGSRRQITAVLWNDTETVYSGTRVHGDNVRIKYLEETFVG